MQAAALALFRAALRLGKSNAANVPTMAVIARTSTRVKPALLEAFFPTRNLSHRQTSDTSLNIDAPRQLWHKCAASMHIPDGFLDAKTAATSATLATGGLAMALRHVRQHLPPRRVPLLSLAAAFIFAAQMLNFPIAGGTSGHLIGGVLAATLLGPSAAVIALACVLIIQCFLFADGGVTTLGANILNMAIINPVIGYSIYRLVRLALPGSRGMIVAAAFASWCATVASALCCAGELAFSGTAAWSLAFPAMTNVHLLIGIGEGLITALVLTAIAGSRPELAKPTTHATEFVGLGLLTALGLALFVAPYACSWPDGLEKIAGALGFEQKATTIAWLPAPIADYHFPGIHSAAMATALAGAVGTLVAFGLSLLLARWLAPSTTDETPLSRSP